MCDLLKAAETVVDEYKGVPSPHFHSLLVKLEEAIAATKARSEWVPVAERLPVVPEGEEYVDVWVVVDGKVKEDLYGPEVVEEGLGDLALGESVFCSCQVTHWQYKHPPAPPRSES